MIYQCGSDFLYLDEKSLEEIISLASKKAVGKVMKRFEIHDNMKVLKSEIKELLYESFRDLEDIIVSVGKGFHVTTFEFKNKEGKEQQPA